MGVIATTIIVMGVTGIIAAVVLYFVAKKFHVYEDPKIAEIEELLPGANCGGCGYSGCHAFACACASATSLEGMNCPGAGPENMKKIADIVGLTSVDAARKVAIVKCNGSCGRRPELNVYDGVSSCAIESTFYGGETPCVYGCLGCGDCVASCPYDAMHLDKAAGLPVVNREKCVGCGKCVKACPRNIMELAEVREGRESVWVACMNRDKGGVAMKECEVACIGCGKCVRTCTHDAVKVSDFLAKIDSEICTGCGDCIAACPRNSIITPAALGQKV